MSTNTSIKQGIKDMSRLYINGLIIVILYAIQVTAVLAQIAGNGIAEVGEQGTITSEGSFSFVNTLTIDGEEILNAYCADDDLTEPGIGELYEVVDPNIVDDDSYFSSGSSSPPPGMTDIKEKVEAVFDALNDDPNNFPFALTEVDIRFAIWYFTDNAAFPSGGNVEYIVNQVLTGTGGYQPVPSLWFEPVSPPATPGLQPLVAPIPENRPELVSIGDFVWVDTNGNGIQDAGESGLDSVTVNLLDSSGVQIATTTTDVDGFYSFTGLTPSTDYIVEFVQPAGYDFTTQDANGNAQDNEDSDADPTTGRVTVTAPASGNNSASTPDDPDIDAGMIDNGGGTSPIACPVAPDAILKDGMLVASCSAAEDTDFVMGVFNPVDPVQQNFSSGALTSQTVETTMYPASNTSDAWDGMHHEDWTAEQIGNIYFTDIDNTGQIYAAASSFNRIDIPSLPASWRYGEIGGGADNLNAAGTVYRTNAVTGAPSAWARLPQQSMALNDGVNSRTTGPGLGGVAYDASCDAVAVANMEDGKIYLFDASDAGPFPLTDTDAISIFDPLTADDGAAGMPAFGERVFGLEFYNGRLYYTVHDFDEQDISATNRPRWGRIIVRSVAIDTDCSIDSASDRLEFDDDFIDDGVDGGISDGTPVVADIEIDSSGRMAIGSFTTGGGAYYGLDFGFPDPTINAGRLLNHDAGVYVYELSGTWTRTRYSTVGLVDDGNFNPNATAIGGVAWNEYSGVPADKRADILWMVGSDFQNNGEFGIIGYAAADLGNTNVQQSAIDYMNYHFAPLGTADFKGNGGDVDIFACFDTEVSTISLGSTIFLDENNDGFQTGTEAGIEGVEVQLFNEGDDPTDPGVTPVATDTTDTNGDYLFENLTPGDYFVYIPVPPSTAPTSSTLTSTADDNIDGNDDGSQTASGGPVTSPVITLSVGDEPINGTGANDEADQGANTTGDNQDDAEDANGNMTVDFGFVTQVSIGDYVWTDSNGDGIQDASESGLAGVTVNLYEDTNGNGVLDGSEGNTVAASTTTDSNGFYSFTGLTPGDDYIVEFTQPIGYGFTLQNQGGVGSDDEDSDANPATGQVAVTAPASGSNSANSPDDPTIDAGMVPGGSIGDHVWLDTDGDGVDDIGEQGIAGVTVQLTPPAGVDVGAGPGNPITITTDANGDYLFDNLPPGPYTVQVDPSTAAGENFGPGGPLEDLDASPGNSGSEVVMLDAGEDYLDADFGYVPTAGLAVIGDTVWSDTDSDGLQDPGEVGIAGVDLTLTGTDENGAAVTRTTTTDASGHYLFTDLTPGDYVVTIDNSNFNAGEALAGLTEANITDGPQSPGATVSDPITVLADDVYLDADFGVDQPAASVGSITDRIWYDDNNDGDQDAGEPAIAGVTLDLLDADGNIIASTVTDANGEFSFTGLPIGDDATDDYSVVLTDDDNVLTGYFPTTTPAANLRQNFTNLDGDIINTDPDATGDNPVTSGSGTGHPSFGVNQPGTIGDTVWNDANANGVQDPGELGIADVTIDLVDSDNNVIATATTDVKGHYLFTNVPTTLAGENYTVRVTDTNGVLTSYTQTYDSNDTDLDVDNDGVAEVSPTTANESTVTGLVDGASDLNQDFGYQRITLPNISGTVFYDVDTDGTHEPDGNDTIANNEDDEDGIAGVTIDLIDDDGNVVATTTTDANGDYEFPDVPPADYTVAVTDTDNVLDGYTLTSGLDVLPVSESELDMGDVTDVDFGYVDDEQTASISSGVWIDSDGDGAWDPDETPVPGVTIDLYEDVDGDGMITAADGAPIATAVTDVDGNVLFEDLPAGNYLLDMDETTIPDDLMEIGHPYVDNDPNDPIALSEGEHYDADFGLETDSAEAGLSGTLWNDSEPDGSDGDGIQDASEVGLGGITVTLTNIETGATQTTTTNPDGSYLFAGLTPCTDATEPCYAVTYDKAQVNALDLDGDEPTNTEDLGGPDGPTTPDGKNDDVYLVHLAAGEFKEDHDFGFDAPASTSDEFGALEGTVYFEPAPANGDYDVGPDNLPGTADDVDLGIESVTVNLVDAAGNVVATTTTSDGFTDVDGDGVIDHAGYYIFTNLPVGEEYQVVVTDNNNATIGLNPSGDPDETSGLCTVCDEQSNLVPIVASGFDNVNNVEIVNTPAQNFGYMGEQSLGNIGNLIWLDVDGEGTFEPAEGDVGLAGVTVECWADMDGDGELHINGVDNLIRTVTTDENGEYYCEGLPTGGYLVRVTDTGGVLQGFGNAHVIGGTADQTNKMEILILNTVDGLYYPDQELAGGPRRAWFVQKASGDNLTADFAVTGNNSLSGTVFEEDATLVEPDDNGTSEPTELDGTYDPAPDADNDTPVEGVKVTLLRKQPDDTYVEFLMTTTQADGSYSFDGLPNGEYRVVVDTTGSPIDGYGQTADPDLTAQFPADTDTDREARVCDSGTASDCDDQATPIPLIGGTNVTGIDFGYQTGFVTTPITLGYFYAQGKSGGEITVYWQTVTETGNVGFNLYGKVRGGEWQRLNAELILSPVGDSVDVQEYSHQLSGVRATRFAISDIDMFGEEVMHGPFRLNKPHGVDRSGREPIDWKKIRKQNKAKKAARKAKREARRAKRMKRMEQRLDSGERQMRRALKQKQRQQRRQKQDVSMIEEMDTLNHSPSPAAERSVSWRSSLMGAVLSLIVPNAYAQQPVVPVTDPGLVHMKTADAGIYRVTYEQLLDYGIDLSGVKHAHLAITHRGDKVAVRSKGQDKQHGKTRYFGPGGWIEFVADTEKTLYTKQSVYALYNDRNRRKTMARDRSKPNATGSAYTKTYTAITEVEFDISYSQAASVDDPWYATRLVSQVSPTTHNLPIELDHIEAGQVNASIDVWGGFAGEHNVSVQLNDYALGGAVFSAFTAQTVSGTTSEAALVEGTNLIKVTVTNKRGQLADIVYTDKWSVSYQRKLVASDDQLIFTAQNPSFELTNFSSKPKSINRRVYRKNADGEVVWVQKVWMPKNTDGTYRLRFNGHPLNNTYYVALESGLKSVEFADPVEQDDLLTGLAQYLVISHPDFIDTNMDDLVQARQAQGYSVKVADVEAVYTAFDDGYFGADAIAKYIAWAYQHLGTRFVLLVGSDVYDYHDNARSGAMSFMPSLYGRTSDRIGFAPIDAKYADIDDDDIPDLAIGRKIPRTGQEWSDSVVKTLQYASHPHPNSIVFAADDYDPAFSYSFSNDADQTIEVLPGEWQNNVTRVYMDDLGLAAARSTLLDALNEGQAVAAMFGHSSPIDWTFDGLFKSGDAKTLTNDGAPTVVTQWGCWNTYYVRVTEDSLAHEFMLNGTSGAAAVLGASTLTEAAHEQNLAEIMYPLMFESDKPLGVAIMEAKQVYAQSNPDHLDVILGWNLLGDPALGL